MAALVILTHRLWPAVLGMALVWLSTWYWHDRLAGGAGDAAGASNWKRVRQLTAQAYPLGIAAMLASANVSIPRLVIERLAGPHSLGVFAAIAYLAVGGRMVALPFGQASAPWLGQALATGDRAGFRRQLRRLGMVAIGLGAAGIGAAVGFGSEFLGAVYGREYATEGRALVIVMIAAAVGYLSLFLQIGVTAARQIGAQVAIVLASILATTLVAWALVPREPVEGGAAAIAAGAVVELLGTIVLVLRTKPFEFSGGSGIARRPAGPSRRGAVNGEGAL